MTILVFKTDKGWVYREWAPAAEKLFLTGDFCGWDRHAHQAKKLKNGVFELKLPGDTLYHGAKVLAIVVHKGQELERIPTYATRVVQDPVTYQWNAQIHEFLPFNWTVEGLI